MIVPVTGAGAAAWVGAGVAAGVGAAAGVGVATGAAVGVATGAAGAVVGAAGVVVGAAGVVVGAAGVVVGATGVVVGAAGVVVGVCVGGVVPGAPPEPKVGLADPRASVLRPTLPEPAPSDGASAIPVTPLKSRTPSTRAFGGCQAAGVSPENEMAIWRQPEKSTLKRDSQRSEPES